MASASKDLEWSSKSRKVLNRRAFKYFLREVYVIASLTKVLLF